jgi:hypothetical protein
MTTISIYHRKTDKSIIYFNIRKTCLKSDYINHFYIFEFIEYCMGELNPCERILHCLLGTQRAIKICLRGSKILRSLLRRASINSNRQLLETLYFILSPCGKIHRQEKLNIFSLLFSFSSLLLRLRPTLCRDQVLLKFRKRIQPMFSQKTL